MKISIRRAFKNDIPAIRSIAVKTFADTYGRQNDPANMRAYLASSFSAERITAEMAAPTAVFLLAVEGGETIAYARADVDDLPGCVTGPNPLRLFRLYVDRRHHRKGCGAALVKACLGEAAAKGYQTLWLGVWEENRPARAFYRRQGFREAGTQDFVFGQEVQQDVVMVRGIDPLTVPAKKGEHA